MAAFKAAIRIANANSDGYPDNGMLWFRSRGRDVFFAGDIQL